MAKILYIFPHPDDESFGPAAAISAQIKSGNEVHLLCLTKGGATKQRHKFGYSVKQMGEVRYSEMLEVEKVLGLNSMTVYDLPDSGLKEMDPRQIEQVCETEINKIKPDIVVTYAVHGISGFHDHLVTHAVVKRVYLEMKSKGADFLRRLAFYTISENDWEKIKDSNPFKLNTSTMELIDCEEKITADDLQKMIDSLDCYKTYKDTIDRMGIKSSIKDHISFEFLMKISNPLFHR
ncbi:MAG: Mycothiol S-conjugate amidase [Chlorobi bacterium OLB4]|nr:MAG: Mycothiol S-conjugate amidase [Chlorobi bacterium OLB4]